jgi:hypothetical protein
MALPCTTTHLILTPTIQPTFQFLPFLNVCSLALECGVEFDDKGTALYDHFAHQEAGGAADPTVVATAQIVESKAIFGGHQPQVCTTNHMLP